MIYLFIYIEVIFFLLGICFFIFVIGGWLVDIVMGRYNVIYGSFLFYIVGIVFFIVIFYNYLKVYVLSILSKGVFLIVLFILIVIVIGGIKVNVFLLGVD